MEVDHPLIQELVTLRQALLKYQEAAHQSGLNLQGSRLDATILSDELKSIRYTYSLLKTEVETLRANPSPSIPSNESLTLRQLSLAHRKLSLLLDETEERLRERTDEWVNERAYRGRAEGLLDDFRRRERKRMGQEIGLIVDKKPDEEESENYEVEDLRKELDRERARGDEERSQRSELEIELDRRKREDRSASAVVERYMAFSQSSSLSLHSSLEKLRTRHTATVTTLQAENEKLAYDLSIERERNRSLLRSLGDAGKEAGREAEGRRREIGLRLNALAREERILELIRRWSSKARLALSRLDQPSSANETSSFPPNAVVSELLQEASQILPPSPARPTSTSFFPSILGIAPRVSLELKADAVSPEAAKVFLAEDLVGGLIKELGEEREKRIMLERREWELFGCEGLDEGYDSGSKADLVEPLKPDVEPDRMEGSGGLSLKKEKKEEEKTESVIEDSAFEPGSLNTLDLNRSSSMSSISTLASVPSFGAPLPTTTITTTTTTTTEPTLPVPSLETNLPSDVHPLIPLLDSSPVQYQAIQHSFLLISGSIRTQIQSLSTQLNQTSNAGDGDDRQERLIPQEVLRSALERLEDITEDARVELEIWGDDRKRIAEGYKVGLGLGLDSIGPEKRKGKQSGGNSSLEKEVQAFLEGKGKRGLDVFQRRLEDLEWDLAAIKSAINNPTFILSPSSTPSPNLPTPPNFSRSLSTPLLFSHQVYNNNHAVSNPSSLTHPLSSLNLRNIMPSAFPSTSSPPLSALSSSLSSPMPHHPLSAYSSNSNGSSPASFFPTFPTSATMNSSAIQIHNGARGPSRSSAVGLARSSFSNLGRMFRDPGSHVTSVPNTMRSVSVGETRGGGEGKRMARVLSRTRAGEDLGGSAEEEEETEKTLEENRSVDDGSSGGSGNSDEDSGSEKEVE
ncbi:hypothetical protein [Phaffia rhodozyma]|uniref:Uncharacterized protein n=1 Tax=Phaffia rhodozyma TaxID=264483 RepID=A0A0F7SUV2_PHARH|nr:hypothetical protein [Phaffia rhodozyma]